MLTWILIGLVVGVVMGMTGAGAAMASVPLFVHLYGADIKTATVLALLASVAGAFFGWFFQRKRTELKISLTIAFGSIFSSLFLAHIKDSLPVAVIKISFIIVVIASAFLLWRKKKENSSLLSHQKIPNSLRLLFLGLIVGSLTTLTGLAGGLILVPTLMGPLRLRSDRAVPTSLATVVLVSGSSLTLQYQRVSSHIETSLVVALLLGALCSAFLTKKALDCLEENTAHRLRKFLLTGMMIYAASGMLLS